MDTLLMCPSRGIMTSILAGFEVNLEQKALIYPAWHPHIAKLDG